MVGVVEIEGQKYIERAQVFTEVVDITTGLSTVTRRLVLPGVASFWLKSLMRQTVAGGASVDRRFLFRLGNTDGGVWYMSGGVGSMTDRVIDTLIFGDGRFPFVMVPPIYYTPTSNIVMEFQDISGNAPYTIYVALAGSYLIPV